LQGSVYQGETKFYGKIEGNKGIIMGNAYGRTRDAIKLTGSVTNVRRLPYPFIGSRAT
jgi:hypothetical protein